MIAIIDYGAGNLHSVKNALDFLNAESIVTGDSETILNADKVILPGGFYRRSCAPSHTT